MSSITRLLWRPSPNTVEIQIDAPADRAFVLLSRALATTQEVNGTVVRRGFKIWRSRGYAKNSGTFAPILYGVISPANHGSRIDAHFQLNPVMRLFLIVWFVGTATIAAIFLFNGLQNATPESQAIDALPYLLPALLPLIGWLILIWQQRSGRADEARLRAWLEDVVSRQ